MVSSSSPLDGSVPAGDAGLREVAGTGPDHCAERGAPGPKAPEAGPMAREKRKGQLLPPEDSRRGAPGAGCEEGVQKARRIAVCNQKGGVGKTTTAVNLASALARRIGQVLLVDLDPQGHATLGLGVDRTRPGASVYETLIEAQRVEEALLHNQAEGLDLLPASINLAGAEVELIDLDDRETRLSRALGLLDHKYRFIIIDCPPSLGILTLNGLVAADGLLVPVQAEYYALEGLSRLVETVNLVRRALNPRLEIEGVLLTMYSTRLTLARQVAEEVRAFFKEQVFETVIPRSVRLAEAPSFGMPIFAYDGQSAGAQAYAQLATELLVRRRLVPAAEEATA